MSTHGPLASAYIAAAARFSAGDLDGYGELLAEDCVFDGSRGRVGSSRAEIVAALKVTTKAIGWTTHEVTSSAEEADVLAVVGKNTFADGSVAYPAGALRFENGKIVEMRAVGGLPAQVSA